MPEMSSAQKECSAEYVFMRSGAISSSFPISGTGSLFEAPFRSFNQVGIEGSLRKKEKHSWIYQAHAGYFYHRFVQHAIPLGATVGYQRILSPEFSGSLSLGGGYLHSIPATARFELNDEGSYERIRSAGRAQAMIQLAAEIQYTLNPDWKISLNYSPIIQTPFVKSYVPLLPYNSMQIGVYRNIKSLCQKS